jgi:hypothetical protein
LIVPGFPEPPAALPHHNIQLHGNILATVHQKANGNYVIEIKTRYIANETLINSVKFLRNRAESE